MNRKCNYLCAFTYFINNLKKDTCKNVYIKDKTLSIYLGLCESPLFNNAYNIAINIVLGGNFVEQFLIELS